MGHGGPEKELVARLFLGMEQNALVLPAADKWSEKKSLGDPNDIADGGITEEKGIHLFKRLSQQN